MNKERRKAIAIVITMVEQIVNTLEEAEGGMLDHLISDCEDLENEEQEYFDNMPESIQSGEKGQAAAQAVQWLADARAAAEQARDSFQEALENLQDEVVGLLESAAEG